MKNILYILVAITTFKCVVSVSNSQDEDIGNGRYTIEGRVLPPDDNLPNWQVQTRIHVNGGEFIGFIREDGLFVVHNVPSGSFILEVIHPDYKYEPVRVEINSKGKFRARKVNFILTSQVIQVPYPLRMKALSQLRYFQVREQWRVTDFLFNPMIIMMVLPLLLIMVLPKMMNDPEAKEELNQITNMAKISNMPEMSEVLANYLSGSSSKSPAQKSKQVKKKQ